MPVHIGFLRAINLGPTRKYPMAELRAALTAAGFADVETHINSGNVKVSTPMRSRTKVETELERVFEADRAFVFEAVSGRGEWMVGARFSAGEGIAGAVAHDGEAVEVPDLTRDPRFARDLAERTGYVPRAMMVAPLRARGEIRGVLSVLDRGDEAEGTQTLSAFADLAALAL